MLKYSKAELNRQAKELGFVRDTFEKVCRLADVLTFMESDPLLADSLSLKGGTAINLTIFNLPRLSVDIDLDFSKDVSREPMLAERKQIHAHIQKYMEAAGYSLSLKSKQYHALDSFVYEYINAGGMKDNLKIEINYMLRCHVLPVSRRLVHLPWNDTELMVLSVDPMEIFAAKTVALLNRAAPRDLYDMLGSSLSLFQYEVRQKQERDRIKEQLSAKRRDMEQNRKLIRGLYEDYVQGIVTGEEYLSMKEDYEKRIAALSADIAALNNDNAALDEQLARYRSMEEDAHRLESDHTLTAELIERLIDRIEITHDHDIHVTFRFQSEFTEQRKAVPLCANT